MPARRTHIRINDFNKGKEIRSSRFETRLPQFNYVVCLDGKGLGGDIYGKYTMMSR